MGQDVNIPTAAGALICLFCSVKPPLPSVCVRERQQRKGPRQVKGRAEGAGRLGPLAVQGEQTVLRLTQAARPSACPSLVRLPEMSDVSWELPSWVSTIPHLLSRL